MSEDDVKEIHRQLLIQDEIIEALFSSKMKPKPLDVLQKKMEHMETILAKLSDQVLFSKWKNRLSVIWERFAVERNCTNSTNVVAKGADAGKVPEVIETKPSTSFQTLAPSPPPLPEPLQYRSLSYADNIFPEKMSPLERSKFLQHIKQSFDRLSNVYLQNDWTRIQALYNNLNTCYDIIERKKVDNNLEVQTSVKKMVLDKLPKSMQQSFEQRTYKTLKRLLIYLSDCLNKKAEIDAKNKKKDEADQKGNRTLPKVETKMEDKGGKAIPSTSGSKYLNQANEEKKENKSELVATKKITVGKKDDVHKWIDSKGQTDAKSEKKVKGELNFLEMWTKVEMNSNVEEVNDQLPNFPLTSTVSVPVPLTTEQQTANTSTDHLTSICSQIDAHFSGLSMVHTETDITGLTELLRAVLDAMELVQPFTGEARVLMERRIFLRASSLMSINWFRGVVHYSEQTGEFINSLLRETILEAYIVTGRIVVQEDGKLELSCACHQKAVHTKEVPSVSSSSESSSSTISTSEKIDSATLKALLAQFWAEVSQLPDDEGSL